MLAATAALLVATAAIAGVVVGANGFGFAVVATAGAALVVAPAEAVTLMIIPLLAANLRLAGTIDAAQLRVCLRRFGPFLAAAAGGTVAGMLALTAVPTGLLRGGLGVLTLGYVATQTRWMRTPVVSDARHRIVGPPVAAVGGVVFGASNVGVQLVAYLDALRIDDRLRVGVFALVFGGIGLVRIAVAGASGLYADATQLALSVGLVAPALAGVWVGVRLRGRLPRRLRRRATQLLLVAIGLRLLL